MTHVVLVPDHLRRVAGTLNDAAAEGRVVAGQVLNAPRPEMPAAVAGAIAVGVDNVARTLSSQTPTLETAEEELRVRAFWGDVADAQAECRSLSDAQISYMFVLMQGGALLRYGATAEQAEFAGRMLGSRYRESFEDPKKFLELVSYLRPNATNADFAGGFIDSFGAENLVEIPRVVQAIEYSHQLSDPMGGSPYLQFLRRDIAQDVEYGEVEFTGDPVADLLAPFSMALANATYAGGLTSTLSRGTEQAIANDEDRWAVAQLLHTGTFGTNFLLDCFKSGVVQQIADESVARHAGSDYLSRESYALGYLADGDGLPLDSKVLVLNALARNDEAARLALTEPVEPIEIMDRFGTHQTFTDPQDLLFFGTYDDDGAALGEMWASGVDGLIENGEQGRAADYTERLAHELIQIERDNWDDARPADADQMRGIADGLARALSDHYIDDLHDSAASGQTSPDWDSDPGTQHGDGELGMSTDTGALRYSTDQLRDLVQGLMSRDVASDRFLDGVAQHQALEIAGGVGSSDTGWAERIGNFNGILTSANGIDRVDGMEEAVARHERIFGALDGVMGAIPFTEPLGTIASQGLDAIDSHLAPDGSYAALMQENARFSDQMFVNQDAAIVSGFYEQGLLGDERDIAASLTDLRGDDPLVEALYEPNAPVPFIENGHLIPYGDMTSDQRELFNAWIDKDEGARAHFYEALKNARDGLNSRD